MDLECQKQNMANVRKQELNKNQSIEGFNTYQYQQRSRKIYIYTYIYISILAVSANQILTVYYMFLLPVVLHGMHAAGSFAI